MFLTIQNQGGAVSEKIEPQRVGHGRRGGAGSEGEGKLRLENWVKAKKDEIK